MHSSRSSLIDVTPTIIVIATWNFACLLTFVRVGGDGWSNNNPIWHLGFRYRILPKYKVTSNLFWFESTCCAHMRYSQWPLSVYEVLAYRLTRPSAPAQRHIEST